MGNITLSPSSTTTYQNVNNPTPTQKENNLNRKNNLNDVYTTSPVNGSIQYNLNSQYFSNETMNSIDNDKTNNIPKLTNPSRSYSYYICNNENDCLKTLNNTDSILYDDNNKPKDINKDEVLYTEKYNSLKYLDNQINITENTAKEYYILLYVWFVIMIIILFVFIITLLSNNSEISSTTYYIIILFIIYCFFNIYKNIYK